MTRTSKRAALAFFVAVFLSFAFVAGLQFFAPGLRGEIRTWAFVIPWLALPVFLVVNGFTATQAHNRARRDVAVFLNERRFADAYAVAKDGLERWPESQFFQLNLALAAMPLWRLTEARASLRRLFNMVVSHEEECRVLALEVVAAELHGDPDAARERAVRAGVPERLLAPADLIRAARERDWATVERLRGGPDSSGLLSPLLDALRAWAREESAPEPIDKVALLGETGIDQIEKVWPDFADFIRRAPQM